MIPAAVGPVTAKHLLDCPEECVHPEKQSSPSGRTQLRGSIWCGPPAFMESHFVTCEPGRSGRGGGWGCGQRSPGRGAGLMLCPFPAGVSMSVRVRFLSSGDPGAVGVMGRSASFAGFSSAQSRRIA
ncbi:RIPOR family member 3 [Galemys pyrenaicus]|uniref:RIPOR family member 3 n=1 Tax=Galemys pyrenaicus TaxID=202257 RepID=A0A8J6AEM2_GALPY|nr:RIPOR family member 3 [Galemys pyrenaicus]